MALERLTQITEVGIQSGITLRNVNVEGAYVSGVVTATTLNVTGGGANFAGVVTATSFNGNVTGNITPSGLVVSGVSTFQASSFWGDGDVAYFGDGQDLLIFHNSTDSIIRDNGTGDLYIEGGNRIRLTNPTGIETYGVFNQDGAVELYHDNVKKFETTSSGVIVSGTSGVGTALLVNGDARVTGILTIGTSSIIIDGINNRIGINSTTPQTTLDLSQETGGIALPSGTSAQRPSSPKQGTIRYNTDLGYVEYYNTSANAWYASGQTGVLATGGTVTEITVSNISYRVHTFTTTGTSSFQVVRGGEVEYLVVSGGGGGGSGIPNLRSGGGGGGGGVVTGTTTLSAGLHTVKVGVGGTGGQQGTGESSILSSIVVPGGGNGTPGGGSSSPPPGSNGACGGGGSGSPQGNGAGGIGSLGGNGGTGGNPNSGHTAGGGGGMGGNGADGSAGGAGGAGVISSISGSSVTYAAGGAGGNNVTVSAAGAPNTGNGGRGSGGNASPGTGSLGGSGIVIVRYRI